MEKTRKGLKLGGRGNNSNIYVVTGPILDDCITLIGINKVCVPKYYYKVIYDPLEKKMISFILPNEKGTKYKGICL